MYYLWMYGCTDVATVYHTMYHVPPPGTGCTGHLHFSGPSLFTLLQNLGFIEGVERYGRDMGTGTIRTTNNVEGFNLQTSIITYLATHSQSTFYL